MSIFNLFNKKKAITATGVNDDISKTIAMAIDTIKSCNDEDSNDDIINRISKFTKDEYLAWELYCFIPIAYCRLLLHDLKFSDEAIYSMPDGSQRKKVLSNINTYKQVKKIASERYRSGIDKADISNILFHSSEFNAINNALNAGSKLENLMIGPVMLFAPEQNAQMPAK